MASFCVEKFGTENLVGILTIYNRQILYNMDPRAAVCRIW
jgi:hypothetical protein